jgi:hypothetical protein
LLPSNSSRRREASYVVPGDVIRLESNDPRILALADRLWDRAPGGAVPRGAPLALRVDVTEGAATPTGLEEAWRIRTDEVAVSLGEQLCAEIACTAGQMAGRVSAGCLDAQPSVAVRLLLETPVAVLLARRGYGVVHAGAVVGPGGAVVIRGAPSAGKSTLVAAALQAGLGVLGDETVLVSRDDPDALLAAVRDVTLVPDATRLLGLERAVVPTGTGAARKDRIDLLPSSAPATRRARRVATVLLGARDDAPARLEPLAPDAFVREFRRGAITPEAWSGTPPHIAVQWAHRGAYRLCGAADLAGAVDQLVQLVSPRTTASVV